MQLQINGQLLGKLDALKGSINDSTACDYPVKTPAPITIDDAKAIAKQLVERQSNTTKFTIDSAYEHEMNDQQIISISYSYQYKMQA